MGPIRGQATPGSRPELWDVFSSPFVQSNGLGGTVHGGGEDFRIGLIREPGQVVVEGESGRSCTVVVMNRCGGLEEPSPLSEGSSPGLDERVPEPSVGEETEGQEVRNS